MRYSAMCAPCLGTSGNVSVRLGLSRSVWVAGPVPASLRQRTAYGGYDIVGPAVPDRPLAQHRIDRAAGRGRHDTAKRPSVGVVASSLLSATDLQREAMWDSRGLEPAWVRRARSPYWRAWG